MIAQAHRHRDDGERRVGKTTGWEDRTPRDIEIHHPMDPAIRIDNAPGRVLVHPRRSHVMRGTMIHRAELRSD